MVLARTAKTDVMQKLHLMLLSPITIFFTFRPAPAFCKGKFHARAVPAVLTAPDGFGALVAIAARATFAELMHVMHAMQLTGI